MNEQISFEEMQKIAQEMVPEHELKNLPALEEISWAFPIATSESNYNLPRLVNYQESKAYGQLSMFQNFEMVMKYLREGKSNEIIGGRKVIQNHTKPIGGIQDAGHQPSMYLPNTLPRILSYNYGEWPKPVSLISPEKAPGFYWINLPDQLRQNILSVGENVRREFDEESVRNYLMSLKNAFNQGQQYLENIARNTEVMENSPRLVRTTTDECSEGDYIELGIPSRNVVARGLYTTDNEGNPVINLYESESLGEPPKPLGRSPKFSKKFPLWRLVLPGGRK